MKNFYLLRTTFDKIDEIGLPHVGIYVIAYLGKIIYVGKTSDGVEPRLRSHQKRFSPIGQWLSLVNDHSNIRLDILQPPDDCENQKQWLMKYENKLIKKLNPVLNLQLVI